MAGKRGARGLSGRAPGGRSEQACKAAAGGLLCKSAARLAFECHHKIPLYRGGPELPGLSRRRVAVPVVSFSAAPVAVAHVVGRTA